MYYIVKYTTGIIHQCEVTKNQFENKYISCILPNFSNCKIIIFVINLFVCTVGHLSTLISQVPQCIYNF